ncbi:hypothetical protein BRD56_08260 [Thermoplasmatales archaeon SW_10_69_26]|nr:MAG: hypothetical protein BRD56_08260 [Thermoplasmatales archaeon SW_10_69_26]
MGQRRTVTGRRQQRAAIILLAITLLLSPTGIGGAIDPGSRGCDFEGYNPVDGCETWNHRYGTNAYEIVEVTEAGPEGETLFVGGHSGADLEGRYPDGAEMFLLSLDAGDGSERWRTGYDLEEPNATNHRVNDLAVHPAGDRIYTATSVKTEADTDKATFQARDAETGHTVWSVTPTDEHASYARTVEVTSDGQFVLVGGTVANEEGWYAWVAKLDASTGERLWFTTTQHAPGGFVRTDHLAISEDTDRAFLASAAAWRTAASSFNLTTGELQWEHRSSSAEGSFLTSMAVSPDGKTLVLAGGDVNAFRVTDEHGRVEALDTETGEQRWLRLLEPGLEPQLRSRDTVTRDVEIGPDSEFVYATGTNDHTVDERVYNVALDVDNGTTAWQETYGTYHEETGDPALEVAPDGKTVYTATCQWLAGSVDYDVVTTARDAGTGEEEWRARYAGEDLGQCLSPPNAGVTVGPAGERLFLSGRAFDTETATSLPLYPSASTFAYELPPTPVDGTPVEG